MRKWIALAIVGLIALVLQGALATIVPPPWCPDLALLVVISIGLRWRGLTAGLCLAALLGFAADLLSGSLLGQHAMLRMVAFIAAFFAGRQLNLKGSLPLAFFAVGTTLVYGALLHAVSSFFFVGGTGSFWRFTADLMQHAVVNGLLALSVFGVVERASVWAGDDDAASRTLRIDPRRRPA